MGEPFGAQNEVVGEVASYSLTVNFDLLLIFLLTCRVVVLYAFSSSNLAP